MGRTVIVTGTGNNGSQPCHAGGILQQGKTEEIQLAVGAFEPTLNVQLWKDYEDEMEIYLESPSGERIGPLYERLGPQPAENKTRFRDSVHFHPAARGNTARSAHVFHLKELSRHRCPQNYPQE